MMLATLTIPMTVSKMHRTGVEPVFLIAIVGTLANSPPTAVLEHWQVGTVCQITMESTIHHFMLSRSPHPAMQDTVVRFTMIWKTWVRSFAAICINTI